MKTLEPIEVEEARQESTTADWLGGGWINTYNGGTERGWGTWPTRAAAIHALNVYGTTKVYHATMPSCEWEPPNEKAHASQEAKKGNE